MSHEGVDFMEIASIRLAVSAIHRRQLMGAVSSEEASVISSCDAWLDSHVPTPNLRQFFELAFNDLHAIHPNVRRPELLAHFAIKAAKKCVAQILENS